MQETASDKIEIKADNYRFVCFFLFFLAAAANSAAPQTFVPVPLRAQYLYNVSEVVLNLNSLSYPLMHAIVVFPANYILDQIGLKPGLNVSAGFMILGYLIRLLINYHFGLFLLGTYMTSLGFIFITCAPTKFTSTWFPVNEIPIVNALILFILFSSDAIHVFISAMVLNDNSTKQDVLKFLIYQTGAVGLIHLSIVLLFKSKPKYFANYSSAVKKQQYVQSIKMLLKNKNYRILFVSMLLIFGSLSAVFVTLPFQLNPYGFEDQTAYIILIATGTGIVGSICSGIYLQKTKKFKLTVIVCSFIGFLSFGFLLLLMPFMQGPFLFYILSALGGFFLFPYITTIIELATEISFPVGEATSSGFLLCGGQFFGFILGIVCSLFIDGSSKSKALLGGAVQIGLMLFGSIVLIFVKEDLKKMDYERNQIEKRQLLPSETKSINSLAN